MKNQPTDRVSARKSSPARNDGEEIAVSALGFLAEDEVRLSRFLSLSGLGPHNLRAAAADSGFLTAVLDYNMADEKLLVAFATAQSLSPDAVGAARRAMGDPPPFDP